VKLGLISFAAGGLLEFAMIQSGFCTRSINLLPCGALIHPLCAIDGAVVATSTAPEWQNSWQEVGSEVKRQLREKSERGDIPDASRVDRVLRQLETRHAAQLAAQQEQKDQQPPRQKEQEEVK
jgi:hypothetical protein